MTQVWGYKPDGSARIFDGALPEGWSDTPEVIADEEKRTAEAITHVFEAFMRGEPMIESADEPVKRRGRPPKVRDAA